MYIGNNEIKDIKDGLVTYTDGAQEQFTELMLEVIQTENQLGEPIMVDGKETDEIQACDTEMRELRCKQVRKEVSKIIASNDWSNEIGQAETTKLIIERLIAWGIYTSEYGFILDPAMNNFNNLVNFTVNSLQMHERNATNKLFGNSDLKRPITQIDGILKG